MQDIDAMSTDGRVVDQKEIESYEKIMEPLTKRMKELSLEIIEEEKEKLRKIRTRNDPHLFYIVVIIFIMLIVISVVIK